MFLSMIVIYVSPSANSFLDTLWIDENVRTGTLASSAIVRAIREEDISIFNMHGTPSSSALSMRNATVRALGSVSSAHPGNAEAYIASLEALDGEIRKIVEESPLDTLIFASRFPLLYFVKEYGLRYYAAFPGCAEETEPSARTVAFLIDKAKELGVPCILNIEMSSDLIARTIAEEAGVPVYTFSSLHNVTAREFASGETYITIMERNADILREALGGTDQR